MTYSFRTLGSSLADSDPQIWLFDSPLFVHLLKDHPRPLIFKANVTPACSTFTLALLTYTYHTRQIDIMLNSI